MAGKIDLTTFFNDKAVFVAKRGFVMLSFYDILRHLFADINQWRFKEKRKKVLKP